MTSPNPSSGIRFKSSPNSNLLIPYSDWEPVKELPDLSAYDTIAVDCETRDPEMSTPRGVGWVPGGRGYLIGISVAVLNGPCIYLPIAHEAGTNLDKDTVVRWARTELGRPNQTKVFHNACYDLGWLRRTAVEVRGPIRDTQLLAALLDEGRRARKRSYALDDLGSDFVGRRKDESLLRDAARVCGLDPKSELYRLPPNFVGPYAEQDARLTLELDVILGMNIQAQGLETVAKLECDLIRKTFEMRWRGVRIDTERANLLRHAGKWLEFLARKNVDWAWEGRAYDSRLPSLQYLMEHRDECGGTVPLEYVVDIWSEPAVQRLHEKLDRPGEVHPIWSAIDTAKRISRAITFVEVAILGNIRSAFHAQDRVHPNWTQLVDDEYGTITGRFSCSGPPLHQTPRRDPLVGNLVRELFLPEEGTSWASLDYSQQEPRITVHYAASMGLPGAEAAAQYYREREGADFHQMVAEMAGIDRGRAKTLNLAIAYGMGKTKVIEMLGAEAELWERYHDKFPFVWALGQAAMRKARADGYVRTLLGRRVRFDMWEPYRTFEERQKGPLTALPREEAEMKWPNDRLERAYTYRAISRLIQASAADQIKKAMVDCGEVPLLQVHDELCFSVDLTYPNNRLQKIREAMIQAIPLCVPVEVTQKVGRTWGG